MRTYADEGKSGLSLDGREALKTLLRDEEGGVADYSVILVYDVSRWGSAHTLAEFAVEDRALDTPPNRSFP